MCTDLILWLGLLFDVCNFFSLHFVCSSDCYLKCLPCKSILTIFLRFEKSQPQLLFSLELIIFELTEISSMHFLMECHSLNLGTWDQLLFRVMRKTLRMLWGRWDFFWLTHSAVDEIQEIHFEPKKDNFNLLILKPNSKLSWSTLAEQPTTTCTKKNAQDCGHFFFCRRLLLLCAGTLRLISDFMFILLFWKELLLWIQRR